jgi:hypothetical protein
LTNKVNIDQVKVLQDENDTLKSQINIMDSKFKSENRMRSDERQILETHLYKITKERDHLMQKVIATG